MSNDSIGDFAVIATGAKGRFGISYGTADLSICGYAHTDCAKTARALFDTIADKSGYVLFCEMELRRHIEINYEEWREVIDPIELEKFARVARPTLFEEWDVRIPMKWSAADAVQDSSSWSSFYRMRRTIDLIHILNIKNLIS